jgi:ferrous iron transport protein A
MLLSELDTQGSATIRAIHAGQDLRRRLAGLGLRLGIRVRVMRRSPFNGPMQIRVGHTDLIMRPADAAHIEVQAAA